MLVIKWSCIAASLCAVILFSRVATAAEVAKLEHEPEYLIVIENDYLASVDAQCLGILVAPLWLMTPSECIATKGRQVKVISNGKPVTVTISILTTINAEDSANSFALLKLDHTLAGKKPVKLANETPLNTTIPESDWCCIFLSKNKNAQTLNYHKRAVKFKHKSAQKDQFIVTPAEQGETLQLSFRGIKGSALFDERGRLQGLTFTDSGMTNSYIQEYRFTSVGYYISSIQSEIIK
ncbi:hypothetical protein [Endozoicomonas lisbonensis]|uniref:Peptidase S1 domain-containing protein n=1 Tax=Endozoicomonas lisbonensis TaxID=3120522 RepID=A0ABV2SLW2_9GAMM